MEHISKREILTLQPGQNSGFEPRAPSFDPGHAPLLRETPHDPVEKGLRPWRAQLMNTGYPAAVLQMVKSLLEVPPYWTNKPPESPGSTWTGRNTTRSRHEPHV